MATLVPGQSLGPGESLPSPDELYSLFMQFDGNVVLLYGNGAPPPVVWATHTNGITPGEFIMQTDGNLVLYDSSGQAHWDSNTWGNPGAFLNVQNDGNVVVYRAGSTTETANNALWEAGSNTPGAISIDEVNYDQYAGPPDGSARDPVLEQPWINIWITDALQAAGLPLTEDWLNGFLTLCNRESSYMPNAVNTTDSNATGPTVGDGNPQGCSRGVAQCIPQTFATYHVAGTSVAIYDPVANIAAASQYVRDRYQVSLDGSDFAAKVQQADPTRPPKGY
jgi:hypothetical protein